ncbi:Tim17/Tim22/Tim23/Pmp24 family-domain-containing protein [Fimicolochytrium jonesii]|uniref:Tim17/Tim22/Tim23/Pmp24 family-domain-containing protein n=1 Tax=Fimicolochytrium jonesii TaxID=1396493 RepID=UPI0022FEB1D0|nr:Tim17/Tim22/Tim23/Pmp24 family-domain-containing protein [Fimicolochytrium jonesii]KAI8818534.1 Tim17/Tim22/Tim23/Pmp24 family-domain-containing protein [Fimicolochytrium jonesii]
MEALNALLASGQHHDLLSIVKGFRNGAVYGAKVRFPHALVMTFLFRTGSLQEKLRFILKATYQHSRNLAFFVTIYKSLMLLQRTVKGGKEHGADAFVAGVVGGYVVFGKNNNVNNQIVLYLFSRIMIGLAKLAVKKQVLPEPKHTFPVFAALVWGIVMWLFRHNRDTLQGSLQASMHYLYNDSDNFDTFKNFLWHNR